MKHQLNDSILESRDVQAPMAQKSAVNTPWTVLSPSGLASRSEAQVCSCCANQMHLWVPASAGIWLWCCSSDTQDISPFQGAVFSIWAHFKVKLQLVFTSRIFYSFMKPSKYLQSYWSASKPDWRNTLRALDVLLNEPKLSLGLNWFEISYLITHARYCLNTGVRKMNISEWELYSLQF